MRTIKAHISLCICSLINAFVVCFLYSIKHILAKSKISRLLLASVAEQVNLSLIVIFLSFQTDRSGQTVQTQIRLLLEEQSDQGLHCLHFPLHRLDALF